MNSLKYIKNNAQLTEDIEMLKGLHVPTRINYIIDQRGEIINSSSMVSNCFTLNADGTKHYVNGSTGAKDGNIAENLLVWLRANTHAYFGVYDTIKKTMTLKPLSDSNRRMFADGTSSATAITNGTNETESSDVWIKFPCDIYWKSTTKIPGETEENANRIMVTITTKLEEGEDEKDWCKWSQYDLVAVYKACLIDNAIYSRSGHLQCNHKSIEDFKTMANNRGNAFKIVPYEFRVLIALLSYPWYHTLDVQSQVGWGTKMSYNNAIDNYVKKTGINDKYGMTDTTPTTGCGTATEAEAIAGEGPNIRGANYYGFEEPWNGIEEILGNIRIMGLEKPENASVVDAKREYISIWFTEDPSFSVVCDTYYTDNLYDESGNPIERRKTCKALTDFKGHGNENYAYVGIFNYDNKLVRCIEIPKSRFVSNWMKKVALGVQFDLIIIDGATNSTVQHNYYQSYQLAKSDPGTVVTAGGAHSDHNGGINNLYMYRNKTIDGWYKVAGTRLVFLGTKDTIKIID